MILLCLWNVLFLRVRVTEEPFCPNRLELVVVCLAITVLMDPPDRYYKCNHNTGSNFLSSQGCAWMHE